MLVTTSLVLAPWTIRNERQLGSPVFTTTHGGFTLLLANNPDFYEFLRNGAWGEVWDGAAIYDDQPSQNDVQDEIALDRANYTQAFDNIRAEPGMFAWSCARDSAGTSWKTMLCGKADTTVNFTASPTLIVRLAGSKR